MSSSSEGPLVRESKLELLIQTTTCWYCYDSLGTFHLDTWPGCYKAKGNFFLSHSRGTRHLSRKESDLDRRIHGTWDFDTQDLSEVVK